MDALVQKLLEENQSDRDKIQKPNCQTRSGRSFLAFYLHSKFKQIINHDKKSPKHLIINYKNTFFDDFAERLVNRPEDRILISITGESASGKSTICDKIASCIVEYSLPVTILSADNYFNDISDLIKQYGNFDALRDSGYDVDSPDNFYLDKLREDIINLQNGNDVLAPKYLVNGTGISQSDAIPVKSNKIVIVEGMCSIYDKVSDIFDVKVYVDLDEDIRKERFFKRACSRNQDEDNAIKHWNYILGAGKKYVSIHKDECDFVINGECDLQYFADMIKYLYLITNNFTD